MVCERELMLHLIWFHWMSAAMELVLGLGLGIFEFDLGIVRVRKL